MTKEYTENAENPTKSRRQILKIMKKGDILQALRKYRKSNCVHYVIFLSMHEDGQSFIGACISSKETKEEDIIKNLELSRDDFETITAENNYKVTYGNCPDGSIGSYLCKCKFQKDLRWYVDNGNSAKVVGRLSEKGIARVDKLLKDTKLLDSVFLWPIKEANQHPELFVKI